MEQEDIQMGTETDFSRGQRVAYVRVSTVEQNDERQKVALEPYKIDQWFIDKASGKDMNRPQFQEMMRYIRKGDTVYVEEFSRLGRSTKDLLDTVEKIQGKGAKLVSLKESFDTSTPAGRLQLTMLAGIAQFEREMMLERQREGIAVAKKEGKYKGRKKVEIPDIGEWHDKYSRREESIASCARKLNVSRNTVYRMFEEYEEKQHEHEV